MHTSHYDSVILHHDGDADGCMYLVDKSGNEIVTTPLDLLEAIEAKPADETLSITGPDAGVHDRFEVTAPGYDKVVSGPWTTKTVSVACEDIENFLFWCKSEKLMATSEDLRLPKNVPFKEALQQLDTVLALLKSLKAPE